MTYRLALGLAPNAPVVEHDAAPGSLHIGDEVTIDGVVWVVTQLAPFDHPGRAEFLCALEAPPLVIMLNGEPAAELYTSELAVVRREMSRFADSAATAAKLERVLTGGPTESLTDEDLIAIGGAFYALEVSRDLTDHMRAVWYEIRDYLGRRPTS